VHLQDAADYDTIGKRIEVVIIPLADSFGGVLVAIAWIGLRMHRKPAGPWDRPESL
jgi:hypothetical protein